MIRFVPRSSFVFEFAEINVGIKFFFNEFRDFAAEFISESAPDFKIVMRRHDLDLEKRLSIAGGIVPDWNYETLAILRKFLVKAAEYGVILFHCSAIAVDGQAYLFAAPSGTGKSTHARLWREMLGGRAEMVNDDKPFVRFKDGVPYVYGSPWNGKHRLSSNISRPIKGICFLEQGAENHIKRIAPREALPRLCRQIFYSRNEKNFGEVMNVSGKLCSSVPLYVMQCNISREAAEMSYKTMSEGE